VPASIYEAAPRPGSNKPMEKTTDRQPAGETLFIESDACQRRVKWLPAAAGNLCGPEPTSFRPTLRLGSQTL